MTKGICVQRVEVLTSKMCSQTPLSAVIGVIQLCLLLTSTAAAQDAATIRLATPTGASESAFNRVSSVRELSNGSLIVADQGDQQLWHASLDGKSAVPIGRKGAGPGEFRSVGWVYALAHDSSLISDAFSSRWNLVHGPRMLSTLSESRPLNRRLGAELFGADTMGHVLGVAPFASRTGEPVLRGTADSLYAVRAHWSATGEDTVARLRGRGGAGFSVTQPKGGGPGRITVANPLASEDLVAMAADGWIAIVRVSPYRVDWRSPSGQVRQGAVITTVARPVDEREQCWAIARALGPKVPCDPDLMPGWPTRVPPFVPSSTRRPQATVLHAPNGQLLVAREPVVNARMHSYDIFDRTSRRVAQLEIPLTDVVVGFGAKSIYVLRTDADGLTAVLRYAWPVRSGA